jgi:hypothetical protein
MSRLKVGTRVRVKDGVDGSPLIFGSPIKTIGLEVVAGRLGTVVSADDRASRISGCYGVVLDGDNPNLPSAFWPNELEVEEDA